MPKEMINYPGSYVHKKDQSPAVPYDGEPLLDGETISTDLGFCFHWDKNSLGQLSVEVDIKQLKDLVSIIETGQWLGESDSPDRIKLYSAPLRRDELQKLIKTARQVRNDVYGSDE